MCLSLDTLLYDGPSRFAVSIAVLTLGTLALAVLAEAVLAVPTLLLLSLAASRYSCCSCSSRRTRESLQARCSPLEPAAARWRRKWTIKSLLCTVHSALYRVHYVLFTLHSACRKVLCTFETAL